MCNCGKRKVSIPDSGPRSGGGARGLPATRSVPPTTVAPMPQQQQQPRRIQQVRRGAPVAAFVAAPPPVSTIRSVAPIPSPPVRSRGGVAASVEPAVWGPHVWFILHSLAELAFRNPNGNRLEGSWASFVAAVAESIPCPTCARHFRTWMSWVPFESSVAAETVRGRFSELHNMVNRTNRVPTWSGDLAAVYAVGDLDVVNFEIRQRIDTVRGMVGDAMLNAATAMLDLLV
jgi:hypothetical protein